MRLTLAPSVHFRQRQRNMSSEGRPAVVVGRCPFVRECVMFRNAATSLRRALCASQSRGNNRFEESFIHVILQILPFSYICSEGV